MNHHELVEKLVKPGQDIVTDMTPSKANLWHMATGLSGEVGELLEALLKSDVENLIEEMGDIEFYFEGLRQEVDLQLFPIEPFDNTDDTCVPLLVVAAGSVLDAVKKIAVYNQSDIDAVEKAMGFFWGNLSACYSFLELNRDDVLNANIEKLTKRYGDKYSDEAAEKRADKH